MRLYKLILLLFAFLNAGFIAWPQTIERYNTFNYNVNEGLLQSTMGNIAVDKNNFCWISFPNGIQKFDGKNFTRVPVQPGLPDDKLVNFFTCRNGDFLVSHSQGISKYDISSNRFRQMYNNPAAVKKPVVFIGEDGDIIYCYSENGTIAAINRRTYQLVTETKTGLPVYPSQSEYPAKFSSNIINHKVAICVNYKLYLFDLKQRKLTAISAAIPYMSYYFLQLKSDSEAVYFSYKVNNALLLYNFATTKSSPIFINGKDDKQIDRCHILPFKNKPHLVFNNRLFETDSSLSLLKTEMADFQNQAIAGASGIAGIKEDNFGNLYIQTINGGIKKIIGNNYPIKYYGTLKKEDNIILSLLPDKKNNRVLAGTAGNGLLVFDTMQRLIKLIKTLPGKNLPFSTNTIIKNSRGDYLLFIIGEKQAWVLKNDFSAMAPIAIASLLPENRKGIDYFGNFLFQDKTGALTQAQGKLYRTSFIANTVSEHEISTAYIMGGLLHKNFIITHGNDELIFLDTATFAGIKKIPFKNTGNIRCFAHDRENAIYMGSNNGIYKIDENGKILQHLTKQNGLPDDCIYAMLFDDAGLLWCSTNKGIFRLNKDNSILQLTKDDGLQENEFNTNVVAKADDGEFFFGGVNGVSSFYPESISSFDEKINLLFTGIKVNNENVHTDTAVWNMQNIKLPYRQNSLSFDFIAMGNNNPGQYIYQYKMEGLDKEWILNNDMQTVRYSLAPGKYVFQVYASRSFDKNAKPMKEIRIVISPPFWKTWWFRLGLGILAVSGLYYFINQRTKIRYAKKMQLLENERQIKQERERISKDLHDNLGAYANAVLYNTELLEKEKAEAKRNELIGDLKFASKDIITSLRETIWALKKETYSAEDCLVRIKNFIQPFAKYYSHIHFSVEGEAPAWLELHYTKALNLVRIIQEAVANSIKHAGASSICVISRLEEQKWKLSVKDDGTGFDYLSMKEAEKGNGLGNMAHRAAESGFDLQTKSRRGEGTQITIIV